MPSSSVEMTNASGCDEEPLSFENLNVDRFNVDSTQRSSNEDECSSILVDRQWHEAAYILGIKEKHILPQVAIDEILSTTSIFISEILSGLVHDICDSLPTDILQLLQKKIKDTSNSLFRDVLTGFKQNKYFKTHFGLVVSITVAVLYNYLWYLV